MIPLPVNSALRLTAPVPSGYLVLDSWGHAIQSYRWDENRVVILPSSSIIHLRQRTVPCHFKTAGTGRALEERMEP